MKPNSIAADEMFPEGSYDGDEASVGTSSSVQMMDISSNEKAVHGDFYNDFEDLFDDEDLA
uniref:COP9 signalosome complex subunit 9 n=1 Tax=Ciona savignyi TaxID=51511 RepID=H2ZPW0_CIOSA